MNSLPESTIRERVEALAPWFHDMDLGGGADRAGSFPVGLSRK